jgi:hypothetical protein
VWIEPEATLGGAGFTLVFPVAPDGIDSDEAPLPDRTSESDLSPLPR